MNINTSSINDNNTSSMNNNSSLNYINPSMNASMLEEMTSWGTGQLKNFLIVRGMAVSGSRQEVLARAFVAWEQKAKIRMSESELQDKLQKDYVSRLRENKLPDPRNISKEQWEEDVTKWPRIDLGKIFSFIMESKNQEMEFIGKYKTHKAYSYYQSGFVDTIFSYNLNQENVIILKTKVTPSMSIRNEPHEVWLAIDQISLNIKCCWCSCIAGFAQTCNHAIAALYKVEFASNMEYIDPSCTSIPCGWNRSTKKTVQPSRLRDMNIRQDNRMVNNECKPSINSEKKRLFDPRRADQQYISSNSVSNLFSEIRAKKPTAVIFKSLPKLPSVYESQTPLSIQEMAKNHVSRGGQKHNFIETLSLTNKQVERIEIDTRGQSNNSIWVEQRKYRLTSSIHHDIHTKMNSIIKSKGKTVVKVTPLVSRVLGESVTLSNIPSIRWGLDMETRAYDDFIKHESLKHDNLKVNKCGLFIKRDLPYLASSPDGMCSCKCCGKSTFEIKCPYVLAYPTERSVTSGFKDVSFLEECNGKIQLKHSHKYFTQIQSQMAITGSNQCFFVVWSPIGVPFIERVAFDNKHWSTILQSLVQFYTAYMLDYIFGDAELSFCPMCSNACLTENEISDNSENSLCCSTCGLWFHWSCAGVLREPDTENWYCTSCRC